MEIKNMKVSELIDRALYASFRKRWEEALEFARAALEREPENYLAHKRLGIALWYLDRQDEGIASMKRSVELNPEFASAYYNLACFYARRGRKSEMLENLSRAIEQDKYTDYREMAGEDEDFDPFRDDEDFTEIVESEKREGYALQEIFDSGDFEEISRALLKIGKEIPLEAVDWEERDMGANITGLLEDGAERINREALEHLFKTVVNNPVINDLDGFRELINALQVKMGKEFDDFLIVEWENRYEYTDPGHLTGIDHALLEKMKELPAETSAKAVIRGLRSHGKDALEDFEYLSSSLFEKLPETGSERAELTDIIDTCLHGDLYKNEDPETRERRVRLALPAPGLDVSGDPDDDWAREKAKLAHFHPDLVIDAASRMGRQDNPPEIFELARESAPRLCVFAVDEGLPVNTRIDALKAIESLGDSSVAPLLAPALHDRSYRLLEVLGEVLHSLNAIPEETKAVVDYLIAAVEEEKDNSDALYSLVCALRWFRDERAAGVLVSQLSNNREAVRREALKGLGILKAVTAIPHIVKQLREGEEQCVTAAAKALAAIGGEAGKELESEENYNSVLEEAERSPRWAIEALNYFTLERVSDDLLRLFKTTDEPEAFEHLARGLAERSREESIPELVELGLDRYKGGDRGGRDYIMIFRSIARAHPAGPGEGIMKEVKEILSRGNKEDILEFAESMKNDAKYADLKDPSKDEEEAERKYREAFIAFMKPAGPEAEALAEAMFNLE